MNWRKVTKNIQINFYWLSGWAARSAKHYSLNYSSHLKSHCVNDFNSGFMLLSRWTITKWYGLLLSKLIYIRTFWTDKFIILSVVVDVVAAATLTFTSIFSCIWLSFSYDLSLSHLRFHLQRLNCMNWLYLRFRVLQIFICNIKWDLRSRSALLLHNSCFRQYTNNSSEH